jgi:hypothetical protein
VPRHGENNDCILTISGGGERAGKQSVPSSAKPRDKWWSVHLPGAVDRGNASHSYIQPICSLQKAKF